MLQAAGSFDILFLDILMADLDGMETARRQRTPEGEAVPRWHLASHRHINSTANTASCEELFPDRQAVADGHGISLQNVRDVADKHHGILETRIENGVFTASLLIPMPEEKSLHN